MKNILKLLFMSSLLAFTACSGEDDPEPFDTTKYGVIPEGAYVATGDADVEPIIAYHNIHSSFTLYGQFSSNISGSAYFYVCRADYAGNMDKLNNLDSAIKIDCVDINNRNGKNYVFVQKRLDPDTEYYYQLCVHTDEGTFYGEIKSTKGNVFRFNIHTGEAQEIDKTTVLISNCSIDINSINEKGIEYTYGIVYIRDDDFEYYKEKGYSDVKIMEEMATKIPLKLGEEDSYSYELKKLREYQTKYYYSAYASVKDVSRTFIGDIKIIERPSLDLDLNTISCVGITNTSVKVKASVKSSILSGTDSYEFGIAYRHENYEIMDEEIPSNFDKTTTICYEYHGLIMDRPNDSLNKEYEISFGNIDQKDHPVLYFRAYIKYKGDVYWGNLQKYQLQTDFDNTKIVGNAVDLGLSVLWADLNIGAGCVVDNSSHFKWGGVDPLIEYAYYVISIHDPTWKPGIDYKLSSDEDAATVLWGDGWRLPTKEECEELINNCLIVNYKYDDLKYNVNHISSKFIGPNGNSIEMDDYYYWTSTPSEDSYTGYSSTSAVGLLIDSNTPRIIKEIGRASGLFIRPVKDKK